MKKKKSKIIISTFFLIVVACLSLVVYNVFATEQLEVIKFDQNRYGGPYGALYSNNTVYLWDENLDIQIENVKDFITSSPGIYYLDFENNFYNYNPSSNQSNLVMENIKEIKPYKTEGYVDFFAFLSNDNKLYIQGTNTNYEFLGDLEKNEDTDIYSVAENVKDFKFYEDLLLYRTLDNELYAMGNNCFGDKVNSGQRLRLPILILENIIDYNNYGAVTSDGSLYVFSNHLALPTKVMDNIKSLNEDMFKTTQGNIEILAKDIEGNHQYIKCTHDDNGNIGSKQIYDISIAQKADINKFKYYYGDSFFVIDKILYLIDKGQVYSLFENVVQMVPEDTNYADGIFILTEDNTMYFIDSEYGTSNQFVKTLTHGENFSWYDPELESNVTKAIKLMTGVKDITNIYREVIIMEDDTIWASGYNEIYRDDNLTTSGSLVYPAIIKKLPNVKEEVSVYDIDLIYFNKTNYTVDDTYNYYANIFPYNADDTTVIWKSSNENVATVNKAGVITTLSPGNTTISVETRDGKIKKEITINVYPKPSGIEIENGDSLDVELYENVILTANVLPHDTLHKNIIWSVDENEDNVYTSYYYYNEEGEEIKVNDNQIIVHVNAGGTYKITASTEDGKYKDTITLNTVEKVSNIRFDIDYEHFDGIRNAFIFLNEDNTLKVDYEIYPTTATNKEITWQSSDETIATVSQDGTITAYKTGRCTITVSSKDGNTTEFLNVLIYDYDTENVVIGDVNGDGVVNILDLIKLRSYLAGLEESLG